MVSVAICFGNGLSFLTGRTCLSNVLLHPAMHCHLWVSLSSPSFAPSPLLSSATLFWLMCSFYRSVLVHSLHVLDISACFYILSFHVFVMQFFSPHNFIIFHLSSSFTLRILLTHLCSAAYRFSPSCLSLLAPNPYTWLEQRRLPTLFL